MGDDLKLKYGLPLSALRVSGIVTVKNDRVLKRDLDPVAEATVALEVIAEQRDQTLKLSAGKVVDTTAAFRLSDDGRLVSTTLDSTGVMGKVVLGLVSAGAAVAGVALASPTAVLGAAAAARAIREGVAEEEKPEKTDEEKIEEEYAREHGELLEMRETYAALVAKVVTLIAQDTKALVDDGDLQERRAVLFRLRYLQSLLPVLRVELERLDEHFASWRAGTFTQRTETREHLVNLDTLHRAGGTPNDDGSISWASGDDVKSAVEDVKRIWDSLGTLVTVSGDQPPEARTGELTNKVRVRTPRRAIVSIYQKDGNGKAVLTERRVELVMDSRCPVEEIKLRKSWWAKRSTGLAFGATGALTGYDYGSTSSAASFVESVGALPEQVGGSLEQVRKIDDALESLRSTGIDHRLARLKKELEIKQHELTQVGLAATEKRHAELERLNQEVAFAEQRKSLREAAEPAAPTAAAAELVRVREQIELLNAWREVSVATRHLAAESELAELRLDLERLAGRGAGVTTQKGTAVN